MERPPWITAAEDRYTPTWNPITNVLNYPWYDDDDNIEWVTAEVWKYKYAQREDRRRREGWIPPRSPSPDVDHSDAHGDSREKEADGDSSEKEADGDGEAVGTADDDADKADDDTAIGTADDDTAIGHEKQADDDTAIGSKQADDDTAIGTKQADFDDAISVVDSLITPTPTPRLTSRRPRWRRGVLLRDRAIDVDDDSSSGDSNKRVVGDVRQLGRALDGREARGNDR
eukprot:204091-Pyramimonas_sp.AAC.4